MLFRHDTPLKRLINLAISSGANSALIKRTATGNPAVFETNVAKPLKSLVVPFSPIQAGSGTPSPTNIRAISSRAVLTTYGAGKNLFNKNGSGIINGYVGAYVITSTDEFKTIFIPCAGNATYTVSKTAGQRFVVGYTTETPANKVPAYGVITDSTAASITITTGADAKFLVAFVYNGAYDTGTAEEMLASVQVEAGPTATAYKAFTSLDSYAAAFPNGETIFCGTIDVASGEITSTHAECIFDGDETFQYVDDVTQSGKTWHRFKTKALDNLAARNSSQRAYCNMGIYTLASERPDFRFYIGSATYTLLFYVEESLCTDDPESLYAWLSENNVQLIYEMTTPQTFQINQMQIPTLIGENTIWTDTDGENTIEYYTNG